MKIFTIPELRNISEIRKFATSEKFLKSENSRAQDFKVNFAIRGKACPTLSHCCHLLYAHNVISNSLEYTDAKVKPIFRK
jgi:hypothetical protein